jgi:ribonuclease VapC
MVVDSSAFVALLLGEPEQERFARVLASAAELWVSAFSVLETAIVVADKKGPQGLLTWDALLLRLQVQVVPMTAIHATVARDAWLRFGKGRHPAALNIGDCCSYAVARHAGLPLLAKGADFPLTDLELVPIEPLGR